ncbi:DNA/RNA polymerase [Salix suchowensis]|nr:DNA/RNA polymerase [Salix suchowensis]
MGDLSIRKVPGIGRVNERLLESVGVKVFIFVTYANGFLILYTQTCGDVYTHRAVLYLMDKQFGLRFLLRTYLGIASNEDIPPLSSTKDMLDKLEEVAAELESDMESSGWIGRKLRSSSSSIPFKAGGERIALPRAANQCPSNWAQGDQTQRFEGIDLRRDQTRRYGGLLWMHANSPIQFFGPAQQATSGSKRKASDIDEDEADDASVDQEEHDSDDDVMPGFHEQDEADIDPSQHDVDDDEELQIIQPLANIRKRPPNSVPGTSISHR